ncbi:MAG TPA: hypothetical protein VN513_08850 [Gemmatimonadales bacterium]|nr:hypothetical protein [Gemmatimonadales bacterium]
MAADYNQAKKVGGQYPADDDGGEGGEGAQGESTRGESLMNVHGSEPVPQMDAHWDHYETAISTPPSVPGDRASVGRQ